MEASSSDELEDQEIVKKNQDFSNKLDQLHTSKERNEENELD